MTASSLTIQASENNALQKTYSAFAILYLLLFPWLPWGFSAILKPLPILCLLIPLILQQKKWLSITFCFAMLGDIMLAIPGSTAFMFGMIFFMLMHCGYCVQFIPHFRWQKIRTFAMIFIIGVSLFGYSILYASMGDFAMPALVYLGFLLSMVFFALHTSANNRHLLLGGILFWVSDSLLGFNEFMIHSSRLTALVMVTYYVSQWQLFLGVKSFLKPERGVY